jgi:hypothetical protein
VTGCCVHAPSKIPGAIRRGKFLTNLSNYDFFRKESAL